MGIGFGLLVAIAALILAGRRAGAFGAARVEGASNRDGRGYTTLHHITSHYITYTHAYIPLHYMTLHCIVLHYITLHTYMHTYIHTCLHSIPFHYITYIHTNMHTYIHTCKHTLHILHYITLHYITLHYITLHCIALHCIALHYIHTHMHTYIHTCKHTLNTLHYVILHYIHTFSVLFLLAANSERSEVFRSLDRTPFIFAHRPSAQWLTFATLNRTTWLDQPGHGIPTSSALNLFQVIWGGSNQP